MGRCMNCGMEITLRNNEENCPNCGKNPYYCWKCKNKITGGEPLCPSCKFFICDNCGSCGFDCKMDYYINAINDLVDSKNARKIVHKLLLLFDGKYEMICPNNVSISYAKNNIKNYLIKMRGKNVRNVFDKKIYENRALKIINMSIGQTFTISQIKEDGFRGQEMRDAVNMSICMGYVNKKRLFNENTKQYYDLYERINGDACKNININDLTIKVCPKHKGTYSSDVEVCPVCVYKKKSKNHIKGESVILKERKSTVDWCQLNRCLFKKRSD